MFFVGKKPQTNRTPLHHLKISFKSKVLCVRYPTVTLLKSITLLLAIAIANPMCCCLTFGETDVDTTAPSTTGAHACCHLEDHANPEKSTHSHDSGDCYHEESNLLKINDIGVCVLSNLADPQSQGYDYVTILSSLESAPSRLYQSSGYHSFDTHSPGSRTSLAYCVFLL